MVEIGKEVIFAENGISLAVGLFDAGELATKVYLAMERHRRLALAPQTRQNRAGQ
jgi:hypothetical protein